MLYSSRSVATGGHVSRVIGDGIVATFGWPRAGGRDAQSAVTCALEIGAQLERLSETDTLVLDAYPAARMAVETGWVLIGEIGPRHEAERDGIIGQAPNIPALSPAPGATEWRCHRRGHVPAAQGQFCYRTGGHQ